MKRGSYPRLIALDSIEWAATAMSTVRSTAKRFFQQPGRNRYRKDGASTEALKVVARWS
jgi:hypothetical protein